MGVPNNQQEQIERLKQNLKSLGLAMIICSIVASVFLIVLLISRINDGEVLFPWVDEIYIPTGKHSIDGAILGMLISVIVMAFEGVNLRATEGPKRIWIPILTVVVFFVPYFKDLLPNFVKDETRLYYLVASSDNLGFFLTMFLIYFDFLFRYRLHKAESES